MLTHGSLSTGICGFDIGAELNGIETKWTCEIDPLRRDIIQWLLPHARHYSDMRKVKSPLPVDIISFGFPCQDISNANPYGKGIHGKSRVFGMSVGQSFASWGPGMPLWRTRQTSLIEDLNSFSGKFPTMGIMRNGILYHASDSDCPTFENASLLLPTPKKSEWIRNKFSIEALLKNIQRKKRLRSEKWRFGLDLVEIHSTSFWSKMLADFHHLDTRLPPNIYNGLVAAAGDTVSPRITSWIFSRIKAIEEEKEKN